MIKHIQLTKGNQCAVNTQDFDLNEFKWSSQLNGGNNYAIRNGSIQMHRIIMSRILDRELLPSERVDHKDGNGLNNRRNNLRLATHTQNMQNRKKHKNNTTGYKGVFKNGKKYIARIRVNGKLLSCGTYETPELAARAYDNAALIHFGEFARLNFLQNS